MDHLFVYGTLRRGSSNEFARMLADRAEFVGNARVRGRLYDLGPYPGAIISDQPDQWIHGEVHRFADPELLRALDDYEGAEFDRAIASARMEVGALDCWIYWYVLPAPAKQIASGDWLKR